MTKTVDQVKKSLQNLLQREIDRLQHYTIGDTFGQIANEENTAINQRVLTISVVLQELSMPDYSVKRVEENLTVLLKQAVKKLNSITQVDTLSRVQYYEANQLVLLLDAKCDFIEEFFECLVYWYNETEKEKRYAEYLKLKEEFESGVNQSN